MVEATGSDSKSVLAQYEALTVKFPNTKSASLAARQIQVLRKIIQEADKQSEAEKELKRIQAMEAIGGDPRRILEQYETLAAMFPNTKSADNAAKQISELREQIKEIERQVAAEKEYRKILDEELAGMRPTEAVERYQGFLNQFGDSKAATPARERLLALRTKIEGEEKAAKLATEQKAKEREFLNVELEKQAKLLREDMERAAIEKAMGIRPNTEATEIKATGTMTGTEDYENQVWTARQTYIVRLRGTILGLSTYSELIEVHGEIRINAVTKQFERTVSAKVSGEN